MELRRRGKNAVLSGKQTKKRNVLLPSKILPTCVGLQRNDKMQRLE